ncbi:MAG TPA: amino acid--tRNA ligase-related protein, partial [Bdellovibrionales bacterium]|nr:amino acid--tRNA ligase-related protein [Bdellovibrionales bacterium]
MDSQKRHSYLQTFAYPAFDRKGGKYGRLEGLEQKASLLILHFEGGDSVTVRADLELAPLRTAGEVLAPGDLVWVSETFSELLLLAPCRLSEAEARAISAPSGFDVARSRQWQTFMERLREFFKAREFTEVRTPTLVPSPGLEPFLDPFKTRFELGRSARELYLPTSPEFHLKKLLSRGWRRVFEFKECFRNNELGPHHQPEFLMLEWYRAYAPFGQMITDVRELMVFLQERFMHKKLFDGVDVTSMTELFKTHAEIDLTPASTREELAGACRR